MAELSLVLMRNLINFAMLAVITGGCGSEKANISSSPLCAETETGWAYVHPRVVGDVYAIGGVWRPGRYDWTNGMTVLGAIMAAGGFRDIATGVKVAHTDGNSEYYKYLRIIDESLEQPALRSGDRLSVPRRIF